MPQRSVHRRPARRSLVTLERVAAGISGFVGVTRGGIPEGRTTLICGAAGCRKALFEMQSLIRGAFDHGQAGAFVALEETEGDLAATVASLRFDVRDRERRGLLAVDHIRVERAEGEENGEYHARGWGRAAANVERGGAKEEAKGMAAKKVVKRAVKAPKSGKASAPAPLKATPAKSAKGEGKAGQWNLRLYVAGDSPRSRTALANLKRICEAQLKGNYDIEVIDLTKRPDLAKADQILAVPTLIRKIPEPMKRVIGDLSNADRAVIALDLQRAVSEG